MMPIQPTYPGVYIEEVPSGVRTILGVSTSITAFVGRALRGPMNESIHVFGFGDFSRVFGGLWEHSPMSYSVYQYFANGGSVAIIVRVARVGAAGSKGSDDAAKAGLTLSGISFEAVSEGEWGNNLVVSVDRNGRDPEGFNFTIKEAADSKAHAVEMFCDLSLDPASRRFVSKIVNKASALVRVGERIPERVPDVDGGHFAGGADGGVPTFDDYMGERSKGTGIYALETVDLFNLLCIPPRTFKAEPTDDSDWLSLYEAALEYCTKRNAMLLVDPPATWQSVEDVTQGISLIESLRHENAVLFFPRLLVTDPHRRNHVRTTPASGAVAGIFARTDATHGVWKPAAGTHATLLGAKLSYAMTDGENGTLNALGVNCLRTFPAYGTVVWAARTLAGADGPASEWKYVPVRRFALFIQESVYRGTKWVVFEPNDEPLWAQIRLNVGAFLHGLYRQGAFAGTKPTDAYFVKCDHETTTKGDIDQGIVNIWVGFAPARPAEFVILRIKQTTGQVGT